MISHLISTVKTNIIGLIMPFMTFIFPIKGLLVLIFLAILFDTIFAIYVSIKLKGISSFKSVILRNRTAFKIFEYCGSTILVFGIDTFIIGGSLFGVKHLLTKCVTSFWLYTELKSIDENNMKLGKPSFYTTFKEMISKIKTAKKDLKEITKD